MLNRLFNYFLTILIAFSAAVAIYILSPEEALSTSEQVEADSPKLDLSSIERGRYIALASDCAACHTAPETNLPYAGGYPIDTPFGKIFSTNITSDTETGIGTWSKNDFIRALKFGKSKSGKNLYPAMPYTSYANMTDEDMNDLWIFIKNLAPIKYDPPPTELPFPFNMRSTLKIWNLLFFNIKDMSPDKKMSESWNRGDYLVNSLGHCSACHTQKNIFGADTSAYLQGGNLGTWYAPDITSNRFRGIGNWSSEQIVEYLKSGSNHASVASGPMAEVVTASTQLLSDQDLISIAEYLKKLPARDDEEKVVVPPENPQYRNGLAIYGVNCSSCHRATGKGFPRVAAALANNPNVNSIHPGSLVMTLLKGSRGTSTQTKPSSGVMPSFADKLSDAEIADVLTYIRNAWGNASEPVSSNEVERIRRKILDN